MWGVFVFVFLRKWGVTLKISLRTMVICNRKGETLEREGRAAGCQAGHCQQLPCQNHRLSLEQAEPSPVGQVLGTACTPLMGVRHGDTHTRGCKGDLAGALPSAHVLGVTGAGWVGVGLECVFVGLKLWASVTEGSSEILSDC